MTLYYDIEADGLYDEATKIHCISVIDDRTDQVYEFHDDDTMTRSGTVNEGLAWLMSAEEIVAHNQIDYDLPVIKKLTGMEPQGKVVDTLIMSQLLYPDRSPVKGCRSGPHSIDAWGIRLGLAKPKHDDWSCFSSEMMHRCTEDTKILRKLHAHLLREEWDNWDWDRAFKIEQEVRRICSEASRHGWLFDTVKALEHITWLDFEMTRIYEEVYPELPKIIKTKEATKEQAVDMPNGGGPETEVVFVKKNWVKKPFLKSVVDRLASARVEYQQEDRRGH